MTNKLRNFVWTISGILLMTFFVFAVTSISDTAFVTTGTVTTTGDSNLSNGTIFINATSRQLSLTNASEEGCFRYNSFTNSLELSQQCNNNFSIISDAGFYGSLKWDNTANCEWLFGGTTLASASASAICDDNARTARGLTTSVTTVGNAEGQLPQIKFANMPSGYYRVTATGSLRINDTTGVACEFAFNHDLTNQNTSSSVIHYGASKGSVDGYGGEFFFSTNQGASTIALYGAEYNFNGCGIDVKNDNGNFEISVYYFPQYNSTTGADYAEWFEKENELILAGDLIGLNVETGKVRVWREGDFVLGIASNNPSVAGNYKPGIEKTHALVGLMGQLDLNDPRVIVKEGLVYSPDKQLIGYELANKKVFIK